MTFTTNMTELSLQNFDYPLPEERIAKFPVTPRHFSKLIRYRQHAISHHTFIDLPGLLPHDSMLVFNDTKVIPARLFFQNKTGANIEIFILEPVSPSTIVAEAMQVHGSCTWHCLIGNLKKWREGDTLSATFEVEGQSLTLHANLVDRESRRVRFDWEPADIACAAWIEAAGNIPLPPYIKRETTDADRETYQTIYSRNKGAVAAPTAGLHFTDEVMAQLEGAGIAKTFITLHVGAGTFLPVKVDDIRSHTMHREQMVFKKQDIERLQAHKGPIIPVGTTSMRSLESLYWFGARLRQNSNQSGFDIDSQIPYQSHQNLPGRSEAFGEVLKWMSKEGVEVLHGDTGIFIYPGYQFRVCDGLVTNFHQPKSTLIMLIAAFIGEDWRKLYEEALAYDYRFLSYGDSCLLLPGV